MAFVIDDDISHDYILINDNINYDNINYDNKIIFSHLNDLLLENMIQDTVSRFFSLEFNIFIQNMNLK